MRFCWIVLSIFLTVQASAGFAEGKERCYFLDAQGVVREAPSRIQVPIAQRSTMRCIPAKVNMQLAAPDEISLGRNIREDHIGSSLGPIHLRWARSVEGLFGRTPQRAMNDAARVVSMTVRGAGFPQSLSAFSAPWQVVFMDDSMPSDQVPTQLITNCHPAWMTPPGNIYIVSERVVAGCGGKAPARGSVADSELSQVLIHEMGHAFEFALLSGQNRTREWAEGFATWFEMQAAANSSGGKDVRKLYRTAANRAFVRSPGISNFNGYVDDYARAAMYFAAVVDKKGVRTLMSVYERMKTQQSDFLSAALQETGWSQAQFDEEAKKASER